MFRPAVLGCLEVAAVREGKGGGIGVFGVCLWCVVERGDVEEVAVVGVGAAALRVGFGVGLLNLLKKIFSSVARSIVPPSTLGWLL